jgi:hypothetical protein
LAGKSPYIGLLHPFISGSHRNLPENDVKLLLFVLANIAEFTEINENRANFRKVCVFHPKFVCCHSAGLEVTMLSWLHSQKNVAENF